MSLEFELSHLALIDIDDIWNYTAQNWSVSQANKYYELIFSEIDSICKNPNLGISIQDVKESHRVKKVQSHLIVYKIEENKIFIDRGLHKRRDIDFQIN